MRNIVTTAAGREFFVDSFGVRKVMAVTALRYRLVLVGVAGDTSDVVVLGITGHQQGVGGIVTGGTEDVLGAVRIVQYQRLMNLVAGRAVSLGDLVRMWLMALEALRDDPMFFRMTEVAGEGGMFARIRGELIVLRGVTGQTFGLEFAFQFDKQRLVRIVTTQTVFQLIMRGPFMAHAALRDIVGARRAMTGMAGLAVNCFFMGAAGFFDFSWLLFMAFGTVIDRQFRLCDGSAGGEQQGTESHAEQSGEGNADLFHFSS